MGTWRRQAPLCPRKNGHNLPQVSRLYWELPELLSRYLCVAQCANSCRSGDRTAAGAHHGLVDRHECIADSRLALYAGNLRVVLPERSEHDQSLLAPEQYEHWHRIYPDVPVMGTVHPYEFAEGTTDT